MPLRTQIWRDGEELELRWDYPTLSAMYTAAVVEADPNLEYRDGLKFGDLGTGEYVDFSMVPIYYLNWPTVPLVSKGRQTLENDHTFFLPGEVLELKPGDELRAWREGR